MDSKIIFEFRDITISIENNKYFVKYDAGAHQEVWRKDEISKEEAEYACEGEQQSIDMLFKLQKRLQEIGINPYVSNI